MNVSPASPLVLSAAPTPSALPPSTPAEASSTTPLPEDEYVPGQLLVKFRRPLDPGSLARLHAVGGFEVLRQIAVPATMHAAFGGALYLVKTPPGMAVPDAARQLSGRSDVAYAEPNWRIQLEGGPPVPEREALASTTTVAGPTRLPNDLDANLWGLSNHGQTYGTPGADIHAPAAWSRQTGRRVEQGGPLVAVIDTGCDYTHPDLVANIWTNPGEIPGDGIDNDHNGIVDDVHGVSFLIHTGDPMDTTIDGHGTHVTGTIGAVGDNGLGVVGVNWTTSIMPLRTLHDYGGSMEGAVEAILYASRMGARVINNSWGTSKFSQALYDAIKASPALNVCAAGNNGRDIDTVKPHYPASFDLPNILSVAATDDKDALVRTSNFGNKSVDLAAPGHDIYSTVPKGEYGFKTGTSMATPHVSGVAALVLSQHPELTTQELKERLMSTVDRVPALAGKIVSGGRVNAERAVG